MSAQHILVVEDESDIRELLRFNLEREGFSVLEAEDGQKGLELARRHLPCLIILDVMLPDGDGFSLFRDLRTFTQVPVLFLSARDEDEARLRGLGLGADDYITKPFLPREMTLRLGAVLRRTYGAAGEGGVIYLGPVTVDMETGVVSGNGPDRTLTAKEYALLSALNETAAAS